MSLETYPNAGQYVDVRVYWHNNQTRFLCSIASTASLPLHKYYGGIDGGNIVFEITDNEEKC